MEGHHYRKENTIAKTELKIMNPKTGEVVKEVTGTRATAVVLGGLGFLMYGGYYIGKLVELTISSKK